MSYIIFANIKVQCIRGEHVLGFIVKRYFYSHIETTKRIIRFTEKTKNDIYFSNTERRKKLDKWKNQIEFLNEDLAFNIK